MGGEREIQGKREAQIVRTERMCFKGEHRHVTVKKITVGVLKSDKDKSHRAKKRWH